MHVEGVDNLTKVYLHPRESDPPRRWGFLAETAKNG